MKVGELKKILESFSEKAEIIVREDLSLEKEEILELVDVAGEIVIKTKKQRRYWYD